MNEILEKYSDSVLKNLDKDNINKILEFIIQNDCDYIDELFEDYLDLFTIDYELFVKKFERCNKKYNNQYLQLASENMNLLEEMFND